MSEKAIEIRAPHGSIDGYLYAAPGGSARPGVVFLPDIGGIRDSNRAQAGRLAAQGFSVLLPNPFYRTSRTPLFTFPFAFGEERTMKRLAELSAPLTPEAIENDASTYLDFLASQPAVSPGPAGVVGYCFTGSFAVRIAAARPDKVAAAASFHGGGLYIDTPVSPHHALPRVKARLYFGHAIQDTSMPAAAIQKLDAALASWGGRYESVVYEAAYHGWTLEDASVYNKEQAERAFEKLVGLFKSELG